MFHYRAGSVNSCKRRRRPDRRRRCRRGEARAGESRRLDEVARDRPDERTIGSQCDRAGPARTGGGDGSAYRGGSHRAAATAGKHMSKISQDTFCRLAISLSHASLPSTRLWGPVGSGRPGRQNKIEAHSFPGRTDSMRKAAALLATTVGVAHTRCDDASIACRGRQRLRQLAPFPGRALADRRSRHQGSARRHRLQICQRRRAGRPAEAAVRHRGPDRRRMRRADRARAGQHGDRAGDRSGEGRGHPGHRL